MARYKVYAVIAIVVVAFFWLGNRSTTYEELVTSASPEYGLILLHGRGDKPESFIWLASEIESRLSTAYQNSFVYSAPRGLYKSVIGHSWEKSGEGIFEYKDTQDYLETYTKERLTDEYGIPLNRIFVIGFSAGGSASLYTYPFMSKPVAGVISVSGSQLKTDNKLPNALHTTIPILLIHGESDTVVSSSNLSILKNELTDVGFGVTGKVLDMDHEVGSAAVSEIVKFIENTLEN